MIADAGPKLEKNTAPAVPCMEKDDGRWKPQAGATSTEEQSDSEYRAACERVKRQHEEQIAEKREVRSFHFGLVHKPISIQEALRIPEAKAAVVK